MLRQARDIGREGVEVIFDPGQGLAEFTREEIRELLELSHIVICNDHEWEIMQTNSGLTANEIVATHLAIITRGANGVDLYRAGEAPCHVDALSGHEIVDPTGCGDAFRAGYMFGMLEGEDPRGCAQLGCVMAAVNLGCSETQKYQIDKQTLLDQRAAAYLGE